MASGNIKNWFLSGMDRDAFPPVPESAAKRRKFFNELAAGLPALSEAEVERSMGIIQAVLTNSDMRAGAIDALDRLPVDELSAQKRLLLGELAIDLLIANENWDACIPRLDGLIRIAAEIRNPDELAILYNYRGVCNYRMTHYPEAKADLEESLRLAEEIGSDRRRSHARTNLGLVLRETGRLEEAASSYRIALELARKNNDKRTVLSCYQNIGNIYRELGRWDAGKKALHGAIDLALELGDVYQELIARQNMDGLLLEEGKDLEKVVGGAEDLMGKARSIGADQVARRTRSNLALALVRMGRADEALEQARIAVEEAVESRDNYVLWRARANLARAYRVLGEIDEAERAFGETLADFDALRRTLTTDRDRAEFKRNLQNLQDEYVSFTLESKGPGAALARLARSKGRALMEFRTGSGKDLTGAMSDEELTSSICRAVHDREGSILLDFFSHEGRLMVFLCCGEKVTVHDLEITMDRVKSLLDEFSKEISLFIASREYRESHYHADSNPPESLMELGRALIGPTWDRIAGFRNLLIVPHGALHHVPFQALVMGNGSYLVETHSVTVLPSSDFILSTGKPDRTGIAKVVALRGADDDLAEAERELELLKKLFGKGLRVADLHSLLKKDGLSGLGLAIKDADAVHFVGHAEFDHSDPYSSALILPGGDRLKVSDLALCGVDLTGVTLVTLSACETGKSEVLAGDEVIGIARGFLLAGAGCMLVSLWMVSDEASAELMPMFYGSLKGGKKASAALREAILGLFETNRLHPYFFAPFQVVGTD